MPRTCPTVGSDIRSNVFNSTGITRFLVLLIGLFFISANLSAAIAYNAAFVAIMDIKTSPLYNVSLNTTEKINWQSSSLALADRRFNYNTFQKSLSFAGTFAGALIGSQPINLLIMRFGAHRVMAVIGTISSIVVGTTPQVIDYSFVLFIIMRVILGMSISNLFPVAGLIVSEWAPLDERGLFVAILFGHIEIAPMFTMPASGLIATHTGWPWVFYVHAAVCALATLLWFIFYRDQPRAHPLVGDQELTKIRDGKGKPQDIGKVPVSKIICDASIWGIWAAAVGNFFTIQFAITFIPIYLSYVLGFSASSAGIIAVAPLLLQLIVKLFTGYISDEVSSFEEVSKLRFFNTVAMVGAASFFLIASLVHVHNNIINVALVVLPLGLLGFHVGGYPKCAIIVARQYAANVMSIVQMVGLSSYLIGSFVVPALTPSNSFDEWRLVFTLYALLLVVSNAIFVLAAKGEAADWAGGEMHHSIHAFHVPFKPNKNIRFF